MKAFQTTDIPQSLNLRITYLPKWISYANGLLRFKVIESHREVAQRLLEQYLDNEREDDAQ